MKNKKTLATPENILTTGESTYVFRGDKVTAGPALNVNSLISFTDNFIKTYESMPSLKDIYLQNYESLPSLKEIYLNNYESIPSTKEVCLEDESIAPNNISFSFHGCKIHDLNYATMGIEKSLSSVADWSYLVDFLETFSQGSSATNTAAPAWITLKETNKKKPNTLNYLESNKTDEFISILKEEDFEFGFESKADSYFQSVLTSCGQAAREWLNRIFLKRFSDKKVLAGILYVISHLEYDQIYPFGQTMAMAAVLHEDIEIRELAIRSFENWHNKDSLNYLETINVSEKWLQDYINEVISDIKQDLER